MAWLQQQSTRERPDTFTQLSPSSRLRTLHGRGGPYIFCGDFLHDLDLEITLGYPLLEPRILGLKLLQAPDLARMKAPKRLRQV
jgi:hypothetical protein